MLKATFPMGSMTGAPKIRAMQLVEQYERSKRGVYSGSVGYIQPNGDFDFNVIIRSMLYNANTKYLSFQVGGAITAKSIPEEEYDMITTPDDVVLDNLDLTSTDKQKIFQLIDKYNKQKKQEGGRKKSRKTITRKKSRRRRKNNNKKLKTKKLKTKKYHKR
jgi:hypothetical protein